MSNSLRPTVITLLLAVSNLSAATLYVSPGSTNPTPPYTNWQIAAQVIQDAVEAAAAGDQIIVTNGTYATGGRAVGTNVLVNRVAVDKPLAVRSVNGPQFTVIRGYQVPVTINGDGAIRCVYLASGASLFGFTLTNGATRQWTSNNRDQSGGGVWCDSPSVVVSNCVMAGNACYSGAGGAFGGTLNDCVLASNLGNGASSSTLNNCVLSNNLGSGASSSTLNNCILIGNSGGQGGGASGCTLTNCTLTGNTTQNQGGGANSSTLYNCTLSGNSGYQGGGASASTLYNCTLSGNSATEGGGAWLCSLYNCTLTGNSASDGGGAEGGTLNDCIVYYNTATRNANGANYSGGTLNYCCTTPMPPNGQGNITLDPQMASASHLSANSPCIGAGSAAYATGTDIDGEAWASPPSIGCDEYHAGAVSGPLSVSLVASYTTVAADYSVGLTAVIAGRTTASVWDFGDGVIVSNRPYASHAWTGAGDYTVALRVFNDSHPDGVSASVTIHVVGQPVHYVAATSTGAQPPYTNWATAAATIQDAVDAATMTGALVLVTNGTYATGGRSVHGATGNRVAVDKPLVLRSVNGPQFTVIQGRQVPGTTNGDGAIRCVYLTNGANLSGFTLTQGATRGNAGDVWERSGGGIWCEPLSAVVSNCILAGNTADWAGGGAYQGTLNNCRFTGNTGFGAVYGTLNNCTLTGNSGGGAYSSSLNNCVLTGNFDCGVSSSTLNNCTLTGNIGGGALFSDLNNCILYFNTGSDAANYDSSSTLSYCCTTPLPAGGPGNFSLDPQLASASHLSATSPCRGAGAAAYANGTDIDGEAWANPPSIGCDEYRAGAVTGPLSVGLLTPSTNVAVGYPLGFTAVIDGRTVASMWDFGDRLVVSNRPYATHAWSTAGDYVVALRAFNESHPDGLTATVTVHVTPTVYYVLAGNPNPVAPYTNWTTAALTIQDAVDVAVVAGAVVLVGDGEYSSGGHAVGNGTLVNRVAVTKPLAVRSVNGPAFTTILGYQMPAMSNGPNAIRCVYLTNGASLSGFTLSGGATLTNGSSYLDLAGGGVCCDSTNALITTCVLSGNSGGGTYGGTLSNCTLTANSAGSGGGACASTLYNCALTGNSASWGGGGAAGGLLYNCTLSGNSADSGGGAAGSTLHNCVVTGNSASGFGGYGGGVEDCTLTNCTVSGNFALWGGGGVFDGTLYNCTVSGNYTYNGPGGGAGALISGACTLYNCALTGNSASWGGGGAAACTLFNCALSGNSASYGGGAAGGTLYNCTVSGNSAGYGGGVSANFGITPSTLYNCIVYYNTAQNGGNYGTNSILNYCCTTPLPTNGVGSITNAPLFVDYTKGNLRLQSNSPCINAGNNAYVTSATDLDGNPRVVSGTVDIGVYEYQGNGSVISSAWLQQYGLPTDGSADYSDSDHDGMNNWQEWVCGTDPTNRLSALRLLSAAPAGTNVTVTWQSVAGVNYFLERSANLAAPFTLLAANILGQVGTTTYTDTNATGVGPYFYRVGVKSP